MIEFNSLWYAMEYYRYCICCKHRMTVDATRFAEAPEYQPGHPYQRFAFRLSHKAQDILYVNPFSGEVDLKLDTSARYYQTYSSPFGFSQTPTVNSYSGTVIQGINVVCTHCSSFEYTIQIHVNVDERQISRVLLNSEYVALEKDSLVHHIRSVYSTKETEYWYADPLKTREDPAPVKKIRMPLIPMDTQDPWKTLERIRKLVIFT